MTLWNLIVVLCLMLLYMGIGFIFLQIRRLREEIKSSAERSSPVVTDAEPALDPQKVADGIVEPILQELGAMEDKLLQEMTGLSKQFGGELDEIRREMQFMQRSSPSSNNTSSTEVRNGAGKRDAYREAKLLLTNGVDEERVIEETGLTVEEVSLLKRLSNPDRAGQQI
ncbi:MAG: hypothetical protein H7833_07090 [Magnetococcus sp. DMHC-1]|nr:hypothetical protein [Magnetococcales bacterium]